MDFKTGFNTFTLLVVIAFARDILPRLAGKSISLGLYYTNKLLESGDNQILKKTELQNKYNYQID